MARGYAIAAGFTGVLAVACITWAVMVLAYEGEDEIEPQLGIALLTSGAIFAAIAIYALRRWHVEKRAAGNARSAMRAVD